MHESVELSGIRATLWVMIEYGWATFPSTDLSSGLLLAAHVVILGGLLFKSGSGIVSVQNVGSKKLKKV